MVAPDSCRPTCKAAELIVLGSRGRSGIKSMVLGSVSYGVLHNSERPLLIVPPLR
jgi:nucleotide-binding universal stress UspA family protein